VFNRLVLQRHRVLVDDLGASITRRGVSLVMDGVKRVVPGRVKRFAKRVLDRRNLSTAKARIRLGVGVAPLSELWGADRGVAICRYYLEQFVGECAADIRGHCLEFHDDTYTKIFGGSAVSRSDILHIDGSNPKATLVADLTKANDLHSNVFDCIICTHVLHVIADLHKVVEELHRILKPGGVLLVGVPHVSMCDPQWHELWRFTAEGLQTVLAGVFGPEHVSVKAYGNSLTAAGQIRGLAAHEFTQAERDFHDARFAVEICARAVKRG